MQQGLLPLVLPRTPMDDQCPKKPRGSAQRNGTSHGLDTGLVIERVYDPDRNAMLAALRVVLGLPKAPPQWLEELAR